MIVTTIPLGYAAQFSPSGRRVLYGYQAVGCLMEDGTHRRCPYPGELYPAGWADGEHALVAYATSHTTTEVRRWAVLEGSVSPPLGYPPLQLPGFNALPMIDGALLSTDRHRLYFEREDITPDGHDVQGPQWDGHHVLYQNANETEGGVWVTYVLNVRSGQVVRRLTGSIRYGQPSTDAAGDLWTMAVVPQGCGITWPNGRGVVAGEGRGALTHREANPMAWTCVFAPYGVIGRAWPWEGAGVWIPDLWHSGITAVVTETGYRIAGYREDTGELKVVDVPFDEATREIPVVPVPPPAPRLPTIPAAPIVSGPRWDGVFFERNHYDMTPSPAACAVLVTRAGAPPVWEAFVAAGPAKPVLADYGAIDAVPPEYRLGLMVTLEGGPEGPAFGDDLDARRHVLDGLDDVETWWRTRCQKAIALEVPMVFYLDGGFDPERPGVTRFLDQYLPSPDRLPSGLEVIPEEMCYPNKVEGLVEDLAVSADRWRRGLAHLSARGFTRLAIARTLYTQSENYPIAHIEACQPAIDRLADEFAVTFDLGFSWARPSGVIVPYPPGDSTRSNRAVLEPWVAARAVATARYARPSRLVLSASGLLLLTSTGEGVAPLEVGTSIHEANGRDPRAGQYEVWTSWEGMPWTRQAGPSTDTAPTLRLTVPGRYLVQARRVSVPIGSSNDRTITVTRATSRRKPSKLKFCG